MPGLLKQCPLLRAALAPAHTIRQGQEKLLCHQRLHCLRTPWQSALGFGEGKNKLLLERIKHNFDERFGLCSYISWHLSEELGCGCYFRRPWGPFLPQLSEFPPHQLRRRTQHPPCPTAPRASPSPAARPHREVPEGGP